jgi:hypothetical protein
MMKLILFCVWVFSVLAIDRYPSGEPNLKYARPRTRMPRGSPRHVRDRPVTDAEVKQIEKEQAKEEEASAKANKLRGGFANEADTQSKITFT